MFGRARPVARELLDPLVSTSEIDTFFNEDAKLMTNLVSGCSLFLRVYGNHEYTLQPFGSILLIRRGLRASATLQPDEHRLGIGGLGSAPIPVAGTFGVNRMLHTTIVYPTVLLSLSISRSHWV